MGETDRLSHRGLGIEGNINNKRLLREQAAGEEGLLRRSSNPNSLALKLGLLYVVYLMVAKMSSQRTSQPITSCILQRQALLSRSLC